MAEKQNSALPRGQRKGTVHITTIDDLQDALARIEQAAGIISDTAEQISDRSEVYWAVERCWFCVNTISDQVRRAMAASDQAFAIMKGRA